MRHKDVTLEDKNAPVIKCRQRLKELRYHGIFKGFYCRACDEIMIRRK